MRLIDADALANNITILCEKNKALIDEWLRNHIEDEITDAPTIDAIVVVRCKDCKNRDADDFCTGRGYPNGLVPDDGFCEKGARRSEE